MILNRKRRRLNTRLQATKSTTSNPNKVEKIEQQLIVIIDKIKDSIKNQKLADEKRAINTVSVNPRYFFSYAKRFSKKRTNIGPLIDRDNNLQQDPKKMADMLQDQYSSVFSDPEVQTDYNTDQPSEHNTTLENITFTCDDITSAIKEIGEFSACGDDDIPSVILKNCAEDLSYPIMLI